MALFMRIFCTATLLIVAHAASAVESQRLKVSPSKITTFSYLTPLPAASCTRTLCTITVAMTPDEGCTATIGGYLKITEGTPRILWKLDPIEDATHSKYSFHKEHGILIVVDDDSQLMPNNGGIGESSAARSDITKFHWNKHSRTVPNAQILYLPIVLRKDISTGEKTICATKDPRIVND